MVHCVRLDVPAVPQRDLALISVSTQDAFSLPAPSLAFVIHICCKAKGGASTPSSAVLIFIEVRLSEELHLRLLGQPRSRLAPGSCKVIRVSDYSLTIILYQHVVFTSMHLLSCPQHVALSGAACGFRSSCSSSRPRSVPIVSGRCISL